MTITHLYPVPLTLPGEKDSMTRYVEEHCPSLAPRDFPMERMDAALRIKRAVVARRDAVDDLYGDDMPEFSCSYHHECSPSNRTCEQYDAKQDPREWAFWTMTDAN